MIDIVYECEACGDRKLVSLSDENTAVTVWCSHMQSDEEHDDAFVSMDNIEEVSE